MWGDDRDEARVIVGTILHSLLQNRQIVPLRRGAARNRGLRRITALRDLARCTGSVERLGRLDPVVSLEEATALRQSDRMTRRAAQSVKRCSLRSEQTVTHRHERLANSAHSRITRERLPSGLDSADA